MDLGRGLTLKNPVLAASGTFGYGVEAARFFDVSQLGAIVGKTITKEPREGNPPPRMAETPSGMLNSIGLQNPGLERFLAETLPRMTALGVPVVANVAGEDAGQFAELAAAVGRARGVVAVELNISCPNVSHGLDLAQDPARCAEVIAACRRATDAPLWAKLTPNIADVAAVARAAEGAGADALVCGNTVLGLAVDWRRGRPKLARGAGGLSGPAIRPIALRHTRDALRAVKIPVIGCGGIRDGEDALEFFCLGAAAVQVGTATFVDPTAALDVALGIEALLAEAGKTLEEVRGSYREPQALAPVPVNRSGPGE
jgi:dihydroorotate dehydrogenase (NAD+) catalytic subunit